MKNLRLIIISFCIVLISACAVPKNFTFKEGWNEGIAAIVIDCWQHGRNISLLVKPYPNKVSLENVFLPDIVSGECQYYHKNPVKKADLIKLPAGQYQIYSYKIYSGAFEITPIDFKPIIFTVKKDKVTYIGRFAIFPDEKNKNSSTAYIANDASEDLLLIKQRLPQIPESKYEINIMHR